MHTKIARSSLLLLLPCLVLISCARLKDTAIGRAYNNVTAKYNGYWNAREIVKKTRNQVEESHEDDFSQVLDVYRWGDEATAKANASDMDKAIEKCTRVIQRHEGSNWIDNAYYVVGEAYFYKGEYYAALDLFKFLSKDYEDTEVGPKAKAAIVRTYAQMGKYNEALAYLSNLENDLREIEKLGAERYLLEAHINIKTNNYRDASRNLEKAIPEVKNRKDRFRYTFILAQIYQNRGLKTRARELYSSIVNKNMPYELLFQSRINIAKCSNLQNRKVAEEVVKSFKKLLRDDANIDYYDQIFYEIGMVYLATGNKEKAIENLQKSSYNSKENPSQKANTYLALADIFFSENEYEEAGAYYDSCASVIPESHPKYNEIKEKQGVLSTLILNLQAIELQDSLLTISTYDQKKLGATIMEVIRQEELEEQKRKEQEARRKRLEEIRKEMGGSSISGRQEAAGDNAGNWYFENPVSLGQGAQEFRRTWGKRQLEDHWRRSQKIRNFGGDEEDTLKQDSAVIDSQTTIEDLPPLLDSVDEDKRSYYANIPFLESQKRAAKNTIIEAMYENGLIYYEQLNELKEAQNVFEKLLNSYPGNKYEAACFYYLYRIMTELENESGAEGYKNRLLTEYPKSEYANLIRSNGSSAGIRVDKDLETLYQSAYEAYRNDNCQRVMEANFQADTSFEDNYLRPNFNYLKTLCEGKNSNRDSFIMGLQRFITSFPESKLSLDARQLIAYLERQKEKESAVAQKDTAVLADSLDKQKPDLKNEKKVTKKEFRYQYSEEGPFMFVLIDSSRAIRRDKIKSELSNYNMRYHRSEGLTVRSFLLNENEQIFIVKDFGSLGKVRKYLQGIQSDEQFHKMAGLAVPDFVFMNQEHFKQLIEAREKEEYVEFFNYNYLKKEN